MVKAQPATDCWKPQCRNPHRKTLPVLQKTAMKLHQRLLDWLEKKSLRRVEFPPMNNNNVCSKHDSTNTHFQKQHKRKNSFISSSEKHEVTQLYVLGEQFQVTGWYFRTFRFTGTTAKTAAREACSPTKRTVQQQVRNPKYKHTPVFVFIILEMVLNTLLWPLAVAQGAIRMGSRMPPHQHHRKFPIIFNSRIAQWATPHIFFNWAVTQYPSNLKQVL